MKLSCREASEKQTANPTYHYRVIQEYRKDVFTLFMDREELMEYLSSRRSMRVTTKGDGGGQSFFENNK